MRGKIIGKRKIRKKIVWVGKTKIPKPLVLNYAGSKSQGFEFQRGKIHVGCAAKTADIKGESIWSRFSALWFRATHSGQTDR